MARTSTAAETLQALGEQGWTVTERTLRAWRGRGCPSDPEPPGRSRGRPGRLFDPAEVRAWATGHGLGPEGAARGDERLPTAPKGAPSAPGSAPAAPVDNPAAAAAAQAKLQLVEHRARKEELLVRQRELELERARGQIVPLEEVRAFWAGQVALVQAHFQTLPGRLAGALVDLSYQEIHDLLEQELGRTLEAFAAGELPGPADPASTHLEPQPHGGALLRYDSKDEA